MKHRKNSTLSKLALAIAAGIFGCNSGTAEAQYMVQNDDYTTRVAAAHAQIEALAAAAEPAVIAQRVDFLKAAQEEYARDRAGFRFASMRWGDFLNVSVARMANVPNPRGYIYYDNPKTYSTSVNLPQTKMIRLIEGRPPDENGVVEYSVDTQHGDPGDAKSSYQMPGAVIPLGKEEYYVVTPNIPQVPTSRGLSRYTEPLVQSGNSMGAVVWNTGSGDGWSILLKTPFPRIAEDDQIIFDGVGLTIYVPAGMGADVYKQLLLSTGKDASSQ